MWELQEVFFTVNGYVSINEDLNGFYSATVSATGLSAGASNAGSVTWFGNIEISSEENILFQSALTEPIEPYIIRGDSTMIGTTTFALPPVNLKIDFKVKLNAGYLLTVPEGTYASPVMTRELPIFGGK